mmetsp:Transcript_23803/g.38751  ORF Transcript_23803/g.38751 Transcript_23803/m.38751 type:complete len:1335 (+) Transcript_23803:77-4081(+)
MSSNNELESGSSLAEDAWAVPSIAAAAVASNDQTTTNQSSSIRNNKSSTVDEAWAKIAALRSKLAADVITDPASNDNNNPFNFPSFISPYEQPNLSAQPNQSYKGMSIPLIYCDQTASQRPIASIENYLQSTSMPCHANTHTNITYTGSQSTAFVSEARQIVGECTGARITGKASLDSVIFGGNGVTGVVAILVDLLNLKGIVNSSAAANGSAGDTRPVVFAGPHEHHSNLLPWRESGCEVVPVPECANGTVDLNELERLLQLPQYSSASGRLRMGAFSAVSNVTGLIADVDAIAIILHRHGALAFFDYASGAPYVKMNMNPNPIQFASHAKEEGEVVDASKDAIYFSPHKCFGGTSTPGVLVVKKRLISQTNPPAVSGGGTVFYVTNQDHRFLSNRIERYEGGTPDGIGIQRCGLALLAGRRIAKEYEQIASSIDGSGGNVEKNKCPPKTLLEYECSTYDRVVAELKKHAPNLIMLGSEHDNVHDSSSSGNCVGRHLPIFSFLIRCGKRFLHYNYVCAVLNDLFGIQSRGGCQCAGPYSQRLLGMTKIVNGNEVSNQANRSIERALLRSDHPCELLRPGYTRLSLPFKGIREEEVDYVIRALIWVSKNGWVLLPQYRCDHRTGEWRHWSRCGKPLGKSERRWLSHYDILAPSTNHLGKLGSNSTQSDEVQASQDRLDLAMKNAKAILELSKRDPRFIAEVEKMNKADGMLGDASDVDDTLEALRWYVYQREAAPSLRDGLDEMPETFDDDKLMGGISVRMDGKRIINDNVEMEVDEVHANEEEKKEADVTMLLNSSMEGLLSFKEGDHAGEASFDEIKAGFEDGELSEACEVFHKGRDEWLVIEDFIRGCEDGDSDSSAASRKRDISTMFGSTNLPEQAAASSVPSQQVVNIPEAATKREKKKPSRDSSQWGQCSVPHITPADAAAADPSTSPSGNVDSNTDDVAALKAATAATKPTGKESNKGKKKKGKLKPPPKMMRAITQAMIQWDMIQDGDRLLLGLSGGKDSLSLLHCLLEFQRKLPIKFDIEVCTIDPMTPSFDPSPLIPYVEGLGLKYHYIRDDIVERANTAGKDGKTVSSLCAFCARMKRGNLYTCARKNNCNKLVLAQHLDDCAESFLMSVMHNGFIRTMKANYQINAGDVSVIRPLVYCRENLMTEFAKANNLPVINENCPACFEEPKERARVKKLLAREETLYPNLYDHIRRALIPVMHDDSTSIMRSYTEAAIAKSRKVSPKQKKTAPQSQDVMMLDNSAAPSSSNNNQADATPSISLASASEEELIAELARRRAEKYKMAGAMKRLPDDNTAEGTIEDSTGQMCSLNGGDGMIPCRELME